MIKLFLRVLVCIIPFLLGNTAFAQGRNQVQQVGKYTVELSMPEEGIVAGEAAHLAFRISDITVARAASAVDTNATNVKAMVTMPQRRPAAPLERNDDLPGNYKMTTSFPAPGDYAIEITFTPQGEAEPYRAVFGVSVKEKTPVFGPRPPILSTSLAVKPGTSVPMAGRPVNLVIQAPPELTPARSASIPADRERRMSLVIVRDDLGSFYHEETTLGPDGTFDGSLTFPTGGHWKVFADTTPVGMVTVIQPATLHVLGTRVPSDALLPSVMPRSTEDGVTLTLQTKNLPARTTLALTFSLTDSGGRAIKDLEPIDDGVLAHLILLDKEAETLVRAHPDESVHGNGTNGLLSFLVRFPKAGVYKGWLQFQRGGEIKTLGFVVRSTE